MKEKKYNKYMNRLPRVCTRCGEKYTPDGPLNTLCFPCWTYRQRHKGDKKECEERKRNEELKQKDL